MSTLSAEPQISLNLRDADLVETLRMLAERQGISLVISEEVKGTVTLQLERVPVNDAFEIVLKTAGLVRVQMGAVMGIIPQRILLKQLKEQVEARAVGGTSFRTEVVKLNYAKAIELAPVLAPLLSPWGSISADGRTNSLIIHAVPESSIFQLIESSRGQME